MAKWYVVDDKHRENKKANIRLPERSTKDSAGYDIYCPCDVDVPDYGISPTIWLDIKAELDEGQVLLIVPRSSFGRRGLSLTNTIGVIDRDYFSNPDNDGNIGLQFKNDSTVMQSFKEGDRIAQAILVDYKTFENGNTEEERVGGFGSTGK